MKKIFYSLVIVMLLAVVGIGIAYARPSTVQLAVRIFHATTGQSLTAGQGIGTTIGAATTSPKYINPGYATTTVELVSDGYDRHGLNIAFRATTTPSTLIVFYEASSDGVDWFPIATPVLFESATSSVISSLQDVLLWTYSSTTVNGYNVTNISGLASPTLYRHIEVPEVVSKRLRVVFATRGAAADVWIQPASRLDPSGN